MNVCVHDTKDNFCLGREEPKIAGGTGKKIKTKTIQAIDWEWFAQMTFDFFVQIKSYESKKQVRSLEHCYGLLVPEKPGGLNALTNSGGMPKNLEGLTDLQTYPLVTGVHSTPRTFFSWPGTGGGDETAVQLTDTDTWPWVDPKLEKTDEQMAGTSPWCELDNEIPVQDGNNPARQWRTISVPPSGVPSAYDLTGAPLRNVILSQATNTLGDVTLCREVTYIFQCHPSSGLSTFLLCPSSEVTMARQFTPQHVDSFKTWILSIFPIISLSHVDQLLETYASGVYMPSEDYAVVRLILALGELIIDVAASNRTDYQRHIKSHWFTAALFDVKLQPLSSIMNILALALICLLFKYHGFRSIPHYTSVCQSLDKWEKQWDRDLSLVALSFFYIICEHPDPQNVNLISPLLPKIVLPTNEFLRDNFGTTFAVTARCYLEHLTQLCQCSSNEERTLLQIRFSASAQQNNNMAYRVRSYVLGQSETSAFFTFRYFGEPQFAIHAMMRWLDLAHGSAIPDRTRSIGQEGSFLISLAALCYRDHRVESPTWSRYARRTLDFFDQVKSLALEFELNYRVLKEHYNRLALDPRLKTLDRNEQMLSLPRLGNGGGDDQMTDVNPGIDLSLPRLGNDGGDDQKTDVQPTSPEIEWSLYVDMSLVSEE
ncbi:hypothetical protein BKA56DRAFT_711903 [Ilyonectria sp. MPI-CAGE-AT-0026]|nr:hypothetical protein BKA56DRAFT_711903 [Ilyonectria sp. MPI-CAGE-AT-0026]